MKSLFFIPVFNQIREFPIVLDGLKKGVPCDTILIINNGSNDGTERLIRNGGFKYIDLPENLGLGYSIAIAIDWAIENDYDILGILAGNGKMLPSEMGRVLNPILKGEADYVTGSRFLPGGGSPNLPNFRRAAIPAVNLMVRFLTGATLSDATCGYRAYKVDIMKKSDFNWHAKWMYTYSLEYYIYAKVILNKKIRWIEVPITMKYPEAGDYSKIKPISGWWDMIKPWLIAKVDGKKINW